MDNGAPVRVRVPSTSDNDTVGVATSIGNKRMQDNGSTITSDSLAKKRTMNNRRAKSRKKDSSHLPNSLPSNNGTTSEDAGNTAGGHSSTSTDSITM